jgi:hypothetical protein
MNDSARQDERGQSLVEAIIGVTVLVAGVVTALALGIMTVRAGQVSESRTIADNLAREGIEQVRNIRDSNWLAGDTWDTELCQASDETAVLALSPVDFTWSLDWSVDSIDSSGAILYTVDDTSANLQYSLQTGGGLPTGSQPTQYRRLLTLHPEGDCVAGEATTYTVTSLVQWAENGATHKAELVEVLTNWRT